MTVVADNGAVDFRNSGAVVDGLARDGEAFQHLQEVHRDSWLNGATEITFNIEEQGLGRPFGPVARRMVADHGPDAGMSKHTMEHVFSNLSLSNTLLTSPYLPVGYDEELHKRKGIGGRITILNWNGYGFLTVTVKDGKSSMIWFYKTETGGYRKRKLPDGNVSYDYVVPPYVEPATISQEWLDEDPEFAKIIVPHLTIDANGEYINPEAGIDWAAVLGQDRVLVGQRPINGVIADDISRDVDGEVVATLGGLPANGTVKLMLGNKPTDHTALTGDPNFPIEAKAERYEGYLQQRLWDMPIRTEMFLAFPAETTTGFTQLSLPIDGTVVDYRISRRELVGLRRHYLGDSGEHVEAQGTVTLDSYGTTMDWYLLKEASVVKTFAVQSRVGFVGVKYLNEVYDNSTHPARYKGFGISKPDVRDRVILIINPPLAHRSRIGGVFNDSARSTLKWRSATDSTRLPYDEWQENFRKSGNFPDEIKALQQSTQTEPGIQSRKLQEQLVKVYRKIARGFKGPQVNRLGPVALSKNGKGDKQEAHIEGRGDDLMTILARQGEPGNTKRPLCPLCGKVVHDSDCPNKPEQRPPTPTDGGTNGKLIKGVADPTGKAIGGLSKAKVRGTQTTRKDRSEFNVDPPEFSWDASFFASIDDQRLLFKWEALEDDGKAKTHAGRLRGNFNVNTREGHGLLVEQVRDYETEYGHLNADDVRDDVLGVFESQVCEQVMVALALRDKIIGIVDGAPVRWGSTWALNLLSDEALTLGALDLGQVEYLIREQLAKRVAASAAPAPTAPPVLVPVP